MEVGRTALQKHFLMHQPFDFSNQNYVQIKEFI